MKISLLIPVYRGREDWKACWNTVQQCRNLFDNIFISFNYSETQSADIEVIAGAPPNVHYTVQTSPMSSVEHAAVMAAWIAKQDVKGMVFFLCHDDLLNPCGIQKLINGNIACGDDSAIFGPYNFYRKTEEKKEFVSIVQSSCFLSKEAFLVKMLRTRITVSSIIIPASAYVRLGKIYRFMKCGHFSEILLLLNPYIKQIRQSDDALVNVQIRDDSDGAILWSDYSANRAKITNDAFVVCLWSLSSLHGISAQVKMSSFIAQRLYFDPVNAVKTYFALLFNPEYRHEVGTLTFLKVVPLAAVTFGRGLLRRFRRIKSSDPAD